MFLPKSKRFVVSQFKKASLSITKQKLEEIWTCWPILKTELLSQHMSTDYIELTFKNGSVFQILTLSASSRGQRATGGVFEEAALIEDGSLISEVILPTMNVPRPSLGGGIPNSSEPHSQQVYITSAGSKNTFAYERLIELTTLGIIDSDDYFICGASYELPLKYGLFEKKNIDDQKMSSTFSSDGFARESMSIWTGGSKESWFNQDKLIKCRSLLHCERGYSLTPKMVENGDFYLIGIDVARYGGNDTSIMVIKVHKNSGNWKKSIVYTENINKAHFTKQAVRIKELYFLYRPREIVIDGNGIGGGLIDALIMPTAGPDGIIQEPLYVMNDKENYPVPRGEEKRAVIYDIKANSGMNSDLYSNLFIQINSGYVALLANERIVKEKLLATKKGQKMNYLSREKFLLPYIMTSRLIDEINNLKLKPTGVAGQVAVEQITRRINKDRVSALAYGLFRVKYYEDKEKRRKRSGVANASQMIFFSNRRRHD